MAYSNKLSKKRFAPHYIDQPDNLSFSAQEYSGFKYGDYGVANKFGTELASYFIKKIIPQLKTNNLVVFSSPYSYIPTASYHLVDCFLEKLKLDAPQLIINEGKINRNQTYTDDYGSMSAEDRFELIKNDTYSFSEVPDPNATLIFIDDISITGTHQMVVENLMNENSVNNEALFLYYAVLNNNAIPANFENVLNYARIQSVKDLIILFNEVNFSLTTRTTKFILGSTRSEFLLFLNHLAENDCKSLINKIYKGSLMNKYSEIEEYKSNFILLEAKAKELAIAKEKN